MSDDRIAFQHYQSAGAVAVAAAQRILAAAQRAISARGRFFLVLAGGRTPLAAYTLLIDRALEWERWHIFLGDERCLAPDDPGRNSVAVSRAWLDQVPLPEGNRHFIAAERGAEMAAADYESLIAPFLPFDMVLLGMGEDGHTASLFPGHSVRQEALVVPVHDAPKPPPDRVSLTPLALSAAHEQLILITGEGKREALNAWLRGDDLPIGRVASAGRSVSVLSDLDSSGPGEAA